MNIEIAELKSVHWRRIILFLFPVLLSLSLSPVRADILLGLSGSYNSLTASQEYGGPTKTLSSYDDAATVHSGSASIFIQSLPDPIIPHLFYSPYFDLSSMERSTSDNYLKATTGEAGLGLYVATGNLYRGEVGFFLGIVAAGRVSDLEGQFNFGRSTLYEAYLATNDTTLDHIDVLNYSRDQAGSLSDQRKTRYLLFKAGALSRENYIIADIGFNRNVDFKTLAVLALLNNSNLNDVHKYYSLYQESTEKEDIFYGFAPIIELGYMGNNFLIKYKGSLPVRLKGQKGDMSIETHSLVIGAYFKI
ncbi:MAG: hypothetical protein KDK23_10715 [Leptospiraceae bacterium]|nr:hypothetical protein [Leptospiraceae bacterium]